MFRLATRMRGTFGHLFHGIEGLGLLKIGLTSSLEFQELTQSFLISALPMQLLNSQRNFNFLSYCSQILCNLNLFIYLIVGCIIVWKKM